jgi:hypothetical protein
MKYHQKDFSASLMEEIKYKELEFKNLSKELIDQYKSVLAQKNFNLDTSFDIEGKDPFKPEYSSSISFGISEKNGDLIDLHTIVIWNCERYFLGIPTAKKIPGSRIIGELLDETYKEVKEEVNEFIQEYLVE